MKHFAKIKGKRTTSSEYGTEVLSWVDLGRIEGFMDIISIGKGEKASKIVQDSTHIFITTKIVDVKTGDRFVISGKTYEINNVDNPMMMNHHLEIELKPTLEQAGQVDFNHSIYVGVGTESTINNEMSMLSFDSEEIKEKAYAKETMLGSGVLYIFYSKEIGKSSIRLNSKLVTDWKVDEITLNGSQYICYSKSIESGLTKIELF